MALRNEHQAVIGQLAQAAEVLAVLSLSLEAALVVVAVGAPRRSRGIPDGPHHLIFPS